MSKFNKGYKLMRLCTLISFIYLGLNFLAMLVIMFNKNTTTDQVNGQLIIFMFAFAPWAVMATAILNVLKIDQKYENNQQIKVVYLIPESQIQENIVPTVKENLLV